MINLGLFSDIYEELRSKYEGTYALPPFRSRTMDSKLPTPFIEEVYNNLNKIICSDSQVNNNRCENELETAKNELFIQYQFVAFCKEYATIQIDILNRAMNSLSWKSSIVISRLNDYANQLQNTVDELSKIIINITMHIDVSNCKSKKINDDIEAKEEILRTVIESVIFEMHTNPLLRTNDIRNLIKDSVTLMNFCEYKSDFSEPREIFSAYITDTLGYHISNSRCKNEVCDKFLFERIPYCLFCYGRK